MTHVGYRGYDDIPIPSNKPARPNLTEYSLQYVEAPKVDLHEYKKIMRQLRRLKVSGYATYTNMSAYLLLAIMQKHPRYNIDLIDSHGKAHKLITCGKKIYTQSYALHPLPIKEAAGKLRTGSHIVNAMPVFNAFYRAPDYCFAKIRFTKKNFWERQKFHQV